MKYIVSFSGGKDSTALLLYAIHKYGKENIKVVFADTGAEFPETFEYLSYIEKKLGIEIGIAKNRKWDFFSYSRSRCKMPDSKNRFCTQLLKLDPLSVWITANANRKTDIILTGERRQESKRRSVYEETYYNKKMRMNGIRPLLDYTTKFIFDEIRKAGLLPHPVYDIWDRLGCYCCVFNTVDEWRQLEKHHSSLFAKIANFEDEIGCTVKKGISLRQLVG